MINYYQAFSNILYCIPVTFVNLKYNVHFLNFFSVSQKFTEHVVVAGT